MLARRVSVCFGSLLFVAALGIKAQDISVSKACPSNPNAALTGSAIPDITRDPPPAPGSGLTISVKRLGHKIPGKAQKEYDRATGLRAKREFEEAAVHLQRAIGLDPKYAEASNDLGVCYAHMNRAPEARAQFEKATQVDSRYWSGFYNLSILDTLSGHFADAEQAARTALDLNRSGSITRLALGMALVLQNKFTDETVILLRQVREEFPQAHLLLARTLAARGERTSARNEVEQYLSGGDTSARELAESWLAALKQPGDPPLE